MREEAQILDLRCQVTAIRHTRKPGRLVARRAPVLGKERPLSSAGRCCAEAVHHQDDSAKDGSHLAAFIPQGTAGVDSRVTEYTALQRRARRQSAVSVGLGLLMLMARATSASTLHEWSSAYA